jgi:hypothetical protein
MIEMKTSGSNKEITKVSGSALTGWSNSLGVLPGIGASLLPVGVCPACWPAYAGLFSSLGFGFLLETAYLLPLTAFFLAVAVAALACKAKTRRGCGPLIFGIGASAIILTAKFIYNSDLSMYGGVAMLVIASLWNAWPRKTVVVDHKTCSTCASKGQVS